MSTPAERLRPFLTAADAATEETPTAARLRNLAGTDVAPADVEPVATPTPEAPVAPEPRAPDGPSLFDRASQRLFGTDVSDPVATERLLSQIGGSLGGAALGARVTPRNVLVNPLTGALAGGAIGSIAGAAAPEATVRALEGVGLVPPGTAQSTTLSMEELDTVLRGEMLLEAAFGGGVSSLRLLQRGATRLAAGITRESKELAEESAKLGIDLTPVQVGDGTIGRGFVAVAGRFPLLGSPLRRGGEAAERQFMQRIDGVPSEIAPLVGVSDLSRKIYDDGRGFFNEFTSRIGAEYEAWRAASDASGVKVSPRHTLKAVEDVREAIVRETPGNLEGLPGSVKETLVRFLDSNFTDVLRISGPDGSQATLRQSLEQMDQMVARIDEEILKLEPGQRKFARSQLMKVRDAVQMDIATNARGEGAEALIERRRQLDEEFSRTMSSIFETATANRFGSVRRRGIAAAEFAETTRKNVDTIADALLKMDSPDSVRELSKLVGADTMEQVAAVAVSRAVDTALIPTEQGLKFSSAAFDNALGLTQRGKAKSAVFEELLKKSNVTLDDLKTLSAVGKRIDGSEIPDASTFVARRAVLGGAASIVGAFAVGSAINSGSTEQSLITTLLMIGGARSIAKALADPKIARPLLSVAKEEGSRATKRAQAIRVIRAVASSLSEDDPEATEQGLFQIGRQFFLGAERGADPSVAPPTEKEANAAVRAIEQQPDNTATRRRGAAGRGRPL